MKFNKAFYSLILIVLVQVSFGQLMGQSQYNLSSTQELKVSGTSTLHDWEMITEDARGEAKITTADGLITQIEKLSVNFPVESLKSGSNRMDRTAYSAIEADKHKQVRFVLTKVSSISANTIVAEGNLTIAGSTRPVTFRTHYSINNQTIQFSGSEKITFSQFDLDPPTALLGTVRTGDDLEIQFDVKFNTSSAAK